MTGQQLDIQWYIARDGKQHGPLSDVEMRTFVGQGHLRPTDLIWRPGFADWRPAPAVFPFQAAEAPRPSAQVPMTRPTGALRSNTYAPERSFEPSRIRVAQGGDGGPSRMAKIIGASVLGVVLLAGGGFYVWHAGLLNGNKSEVAAADAPDPTREPLSSTGASPVAPSSGIATLAPPSASTSEQVQTAAEAPPIAPVSSETVEKSAQALDAQFQRTPMWTVVKREFPDWYSEQLKEAGKLSAENQPQLAITKHLAQALVELRRKHADEALAASTEKLKLVANAFLDNLKSLSERGIGACYGFISQGETAPAVLELMQSPDGAAVQAQVTAIFEAIAEGRKTPKSHQRALKTDYEVLVQQLTKLGWKENDLKTFSNPTALSREPPARVCQMVQDWFLAHLSVQDKAAQERLLVETLKPVVSG